MYILLIHHDQNSRKNISEALERDFKANITAVGNFQHALEFLIADSQLHLIICDNTSEAGKLFKYLLTVGSKVPRILINAAAGIPAPQLSDEIIATINQPDLIKGLREKIREALENGKLSLMAMDQGFCQISTELLVKVVPLQADIYLKLSEIKYIKIFKKGDVFQAQDLSRFLSDRKIEYLYLKKDESPEFINKFKKAVVTILNRRSTANPEIPHVTQAVLEVVMELGSKLGFTPEIQKIVSHNVKAVVEAVRVQPQLSKIFSYITQNPEKYVPAHSVLVAHVACFFAVKLSWCSDFTMEKLTFAGFLHDITITNQILATVDNLDEFEKVKGQFSSAEVHSYLNHPTDCAKICAQFADIPPDVETIILQHHEGREGNGFPRRYSVNNVAPLASVFIVAHELVDNFLKKRDVNEYLPEMNTKYSHGNFKKIMKCIAFE